MLATLRSKMSILFFTFFLLVLISVVATFAALRAQEQDALVINLAGRQRMLTQKMTWLALTQADSAALTESIQLFDTTLAALRIGGPTLDANGKAVHLPPAPDAELRAQLDIAARDWQTFRSHLQPTNSRALQNESPQILAQLEALVSAFQSRADAKLNTLQNIQLVSFIAAVFLLGIGYLLTYRQILQPLAALGSIARRIGTGQLDAPVPAMGHDEFGELGATFETMRAQIAAARGQLQAQVAQRTYEIESAFEFSQEIVADLDLGHLLKSVTERARALTRAQTATICLLESSHTALKLGATSGDSPLIQAGALQPVGRGLTAQVVVAGETVVAPTACATCAFFAAQAPGLSAVAPLRAGKTILGAMCVARKLDEQFGENEARALTLLANSAAIAIANARLAEASRQQAERAATLAERERLAAELHDDLAQTLGFLNLKTTQVNELLDKTNSHAKRELAQMKPAIDLAYRQVRAALVGLREPEPSSATLAQALAQCCAEFQHTAGISTELKFDADAALGLAPVAQTQVLHIVRESLVNIKRHAHAAHVRVDVTVVDARLHVSVQDDGIGFELTPGYGEQHLGLTIMRTRAERSGGTFHIESAPGAGTRIMATFPINGAHV